MSARAASLAHPPQEHRETAQVRWVAPSAAAEAQRRARPQALQPAGPGLMHRRAARIALRAALALVVAAVSVAAAWAVRANVTSTDPPPSRPARVVELGSASLRTPSGWAPERAAVARVPGLGAPVAVFAPTPGLDAHAVLTVASTDDPSMIAAPLRDFLGPPGRSSERTLAGLPASSYPPRAVAGGRTADVTVARISGGVLTVICIADSAAWVGAAGCAEELTDGSPGAAATALARAG